MLWQRITTFMMKRLLSPLLIGCWIASVYSASPTIAPTIQTGNNYAFVVAGTDSPSATVSSGNNGRATSAVFVGPKGVWQDSTGVIFISDTDDDCIRSFDADGDTIITTYAGTCGSGGDTGSGGKATSAKINAPLGLMADTTGTMWFADDNTNRLKKISTTGILTNVGGDGTTAAPIYNVAATSSPFYNICDVWIDSQASIIIAFESYDQIGKVTSSGTFKLVAGVYLAGAFGGDGGPATSAKLNGCTRLTGDTTGQIILSDNDNYRVRTISTSNIITTRAGTGTTTYTTDNLPATSMNIGEPLGMHVDDVTGDLYFNDFTNNRIFVHTVSSDRVSLYAGTGTSGNTGNGGLATAATFSSLRYLFRSTSGIVYVTDYTHNIVKKVVNLSPTIAPTRIPTVIPTQSPTVVPTDQPSQSPTVSPTVQPSASPTVQPSASPTVTPSAAPSASPTVTPSAAPSASPTVTPSAAPSASPTVTPSAAPSVAPTLAPSVTPTVTPSIEPSKVPSVQPSELPTLSYLSIRSSPSFTVTNALAFAGLRSSGSVITWGSSLAGGDSSSVTSLLVNVISIVSSKNAFAALKSDGSVVAWGASDEIEGWTAYQSATNIESLVANEEAFAGLTSDGGVIAFGSDCCGGNVDQFGWSSPYLSSDVLSIHASAGAFCALKSNGNVYTWGNEFSGGGVSSVTRSDLIDVVYVTATRSAFAAMTSDGSVLNWGNKVFGGGDLSTVESLSQNTKHIVSNSGAFVAYTNEKDLVSWGSSQGGGGSSVDGGVDGVSFIASTSVAFTALRPNGSIVSWGDSEGGGDSSGVNDVTNITSIVGNSRAFAALTANGTVVTWGYIYGGVELTSSLTNVTAIYHTSRAFAALKFDGSVMTWGASYFGGLVDSTISAYLESKVQLICTNDVAFTAIRSDGVAVAWGHSKASLGSGVLSGDYSSIVSC